MEKRNPYSEKQESDIAFSKAVNAGKRIYYLDVKRNRKNELFLSITESKRIISNNPENLFQFEKHKIFLYREDFSKFVNAMNETFAFIMQNEKPESEEENPIELKIEF